MRAGLFLSCPGSSERLFVCRACRAVMAEPCLSTGCRTPSSKMPAILVLPSKVSQEIATQANTLPLLSHQLTTRLSRRQGFADKTRNLVLFLPVSFSWGCLWIFFGMAWPEKGCKYLTMKTLSCKVWQREALGIENLRSRWNYVPS